MGFRHECLGVICSLDLIDGPLTEPGLNDLPGSWRAEGRERRGGEERGEEERKTGRENKPYNATDSISHLCPTLEDPRHVEHQQDSWGCMQTHARWRVKGEG